MGDQPRAYMLGQPCIHASCRPSRGVRTLAVSDLTHARVGHCTEHDAARISTVSLASAPLTSSRLAGVDQTCCELGQAQLHTPNAVLGALHLGVAGTARANRDCMC